MDAQWEVITIATASRVRRPVFFSRRAGASRMSLRRHLTKKSPVQRQYRSLEEQGEGGDPGQKGT
jgi:hypothetical protein